jgi:DNA-binding MarR family transcriptional regulator
VFQVVPDSTVPLSVAPVEGPSLKKIRKLDRAFRLFRDIEDTIPLPLAHALVSVALNEGKSLQELADASGISLSNMSRYMLSLSDRSRTGGPGSGFGLVVREQDQSNLRKNSYYLSDAGRLFFNELVEVL